MSAAAIAGSAAEPRASSAERGACRHCGLPIGASDELGPFCCAGCRAVHELLKSEGLERYYDLRDGAEAPPPELRPGTFAWLDAALARLVPDANGVVRTSLDVQGVHCAACVWLLQELWKREAGHVDLRVNPALGRAELAWKPAQLDLRSYLRAVERFGYRFGPARKGELAVSRDLVVRLGVCMAAAANVMIFSLCYYAGLDAREGDLYVVLGRWSFALATIAVLAGGTLFFRSAWRGISQRVAHLDLPIALGIALGYAGSTWAWLARGPEAAYFDTITVFIALMVLGRWLQERVLQRNRSLLLQSDGVDDLFTRRRRGSELETVPAAAIEPGDELWILPGDLVPVEGTVVGERATLNLDWITGESRPRVFEPGEVAPAGAFQSGTSTLRLAAHEGFAASRLHALLGAPASDRSAAREHATREERFWARFPAYYVAGVLALAALAVALSWHRGAQSAVEVALSVLVVTCPCALGLATPLANELVHAGLRRRGIFLREGAFLRRVLAVRHVLFDKTGTLTRGTLRLARATRDDLERLDAEARRVIENAVARSNHPVSRCILAELARSNRVALLDGVDVVELPGRGLELRHAGHTWRLGAPAFALGEDDAVRTSSGALSADDAWRAKDEPTGEVALASAGAERKTLFTRDGTVVLALELEETLKPGADREVAALQREGLAVHLLSGDKTERAHLVGAALGIPSGNVLGDLSPEDKARRVRELDRGDTWMVGDGINDGLAFDAATCAATPAVDRPNLPARADLFYLGDGISAVRETMHWARRLSTVLRANLVLALLYNAAAVTLCLLGLVGPLTAALLMPASSIVFLTSTTWRLSGRRVAWTS
ncbi:MAG: heavy metal translocating P-type ATPase metal-binding domain-containing protein [Planctomycetes bacterium]|nr:heavy metal translocating P-type ATPase metal-binding domain-containing protein [Planctomycetota bacterium]